MARLRSQKSQKSLIRHYTPPPNLANYNGQAKTPQRSAIFALQALARKRGLMITREEIKEITGVATRSQARILKSKQLCTRHNHPDTGPDPCGRKRSLTRSETAAISDYLEDESVPLDDRGAPWQDIAEAASVDLPKSVHFKPPGLRTIDARVIQRACRDDEDIINAVCKEEKELDEKQAQTRYKYANEQLNACPKSLDWIDVAFCDEFHLGIGPTIIKRVKR